MASLGYLETDYAEFPYGSGRVDDFLSSQFLAVNTKHKSLASQSEFLIDEFEKTPAQYELVNTKPKKSGSQFLNTAFFDKKSGSQFYAFIDSGFDKKSIQFRTTKIVNKSIGKYLIEKENGYLNNIYLSPIHAKFMGSQFDVFKIKSKGAQVKATIYNSTQFRFMYDFPSRGLDGQNWTLANGSTMQGDFSINNLNTDIIEQVWRSSNTSIQSLVCDTQDDSGVFLDTLAILNHNLTLGAIVNLFGSNEPDFSSNIFSERLVTTSKNIYYVSETIPLKSYRYWKIEITDSLNPDGYLEIGSIVFGSSVVFSSKENFTDKLDFGIIQFKDTIQTEGFTNVSNDRGQKRFLTLNFKKLEADGRNFLELRKMFEKAGSILKVLWIPFPEDPKRFSVFSKMVDIPKEKHTYLSQSFVDLTIKTDESM